MWVECWTECCVHIFLFHGNLQTNKMHVVNNVNQRHVIHFKNFPKCSSICQYPPTFANKVHKSSHHGCANNVGLMMLMWLTPAFNTFHTQTNRLQSFNLFPTAIVIVLTGLYIFCCLKKK